jgi:hypothetical protein
VRSIEIAALSQSAWRKRLGESASERCLPSKPAVVLWRWGPLIGSTDSLVAVEVLLSVVALQLVPFVGTLEDQKFHYWRIRCLDLRPGEITDEKNIATLAARPLMELGTG